MIPSLISDRWQAWRKRVRSWVQRDAANCELDDELAFHVEMATRSGIAAGLSPAEARRAALVEFGGVDRYRTQVREVRGVRWLSEWLQDLRLTARSARRTPAFTTVVVGTLALGIGGAVTLFGVLDAVVLRALPFPAADRLVHVWETTPEGSDFTASEPNFLDFRVLNRTFDELAAYRLDELALTGSGTPRIVRAAAASHTLFDVLGVEPIAGRRYTAEEDRVEGNRRVALLGHALWHSTFGGAPDVLGRALTLDGEPHTIIGVLPDGFQLVDADVWVPLAARPYADRGDHWLNMVGRLAPGVSLEAAARDLDAIAARIGAEHPLVAGWGTRVLPLEEWLVEPPVRHASLLLFGAVVLLLLIACVNVAGLMLARATARQTDLSVRAALGAGRGRLRRQLLAESTAFGLLGGGMGMLAATWALAMLRRVPTTTVPRIDGATFDLRVATFAIGVSVLTGLLVGILPARAAGRVDVHTALKQTGRAGGARTQRLREALVVAQVAIAVVLLVGSGLLMRSLLRVQAVDAGFQSEHVWAIPLQLPTAGYAEPWQKAVFYAEAIERLEAIPGVVAAAATNVLPFSDWNYVNDVTPEHLGAEHPNGGYLSASWRIVTPGYFEAAGIPLLQGRTFTSDDRHERQPVAVVTRTLAERMWPGRNAVGQRLYWGGTDGEPRTVVGVTGDIRDVELEAEPPPVMFLPTGQITWPAITLIVRAGGDLPAAGTAFRTALAAVDPDLPVTGIVALREQRSTATRQRRMQTTLLAIFAGAALLLATIGLYGVLSFAVVQRTREIGIRIALGARPAGVIRMLARRGVTLTALGIAIGSVLALVAARLMNSLLFQTSAVDPFAWLAVVALFTTVAAIATALPARRASRTDPLTALRAE